MPTPWAIIFARNVLADDPGELDEDWLADQLDRFAAQLGAEPLWQVRRQNGATLLVRARTVSDAKEWVEKFAGIGGADIITIEPVVERAPPQTGGGDAGERAREHASAVLYRVTEHLAKTGEWAEEDIDALRAGLAMLDSREADLRSSHREGAEAMRADCALTLRQRKDQWDDDHNRGHCCSLTVQNELGASEAAIRALPIPKK